METVRALRGPERRRVSRVIVLRERRSGFERRSRGRSWLGSQIEGSLVYLRDHPAGLALLLLVGNMLSLADLALTRLSFSLGGSEANPLMRHLLAAHPTSALAVKIGLVAAMSAVIWKLRRRRRILGLALYLVVFYCVLVFYELAAIGQVG